MGASQVGILSILVSVTTTTFGILLGLSPIGCFKLVVIDPISRPLARAARDVM